MFSFPYEASTYAASPRRAKMEEATVRKLRSILASFPPALLDSIVGFKAKGTRLLHGSSFLLTFRMLFMAVRGLVDKVFEGEKYPSVLRSLADAGILDTMFSAITETFELDADYGDIPLVGRPWVLGAMTLGLYLSLCCQCLPASEAVDLVYGRWSRDMPSILQNLCNAESQLWARLERCLSEQLARMDEVMMNLALLAAPFKLHTIAELQAALLINRLKPASPELCRVSIRFLCKIRKAILSPNSSPPYNINFVTMIPGMLSGAARTLHRVHGEAAEWATITRRPERELVQQSLALTGGVQSEDSDDDPKSLEDKHTVAFGQLFSLDAMLAFGSPTFELAQACAEMQIVPWTASVLRKSRSWYTTLPTPSGLPYSGVIMDKSTTLTEIALNVARSIGYIARRRGVVSLAEDLARERMIALLEFAAYTHGDNISMTESSVAAIWIIHILLLLIEFRSLRLASEVWRQTKTIVYRSLLRKPNTGPETNTSFRELGLLIHTLSRAAASRRADGFDALEFDPAMVCATVGCESLERPGSQCVACKARFYCNRQCQKLDWKSHKRACEAMKKDPRVNNAQIKESIASVKRHVLSAKLEERFEDCLTDIGKYDAWHIFES